MLTAPDLESKASFETRTYTGSQSVMTTDNVSKPSIDSPIKPSIDQPGSSVNQPRTSPVQLGSPQDQQGSSPDQPNAFPPPPRPSTDCGGRRSKSISVDGKLDGKLDGKAGSKDTKFKKFLTWLTDPDTRDAARAEKRGKPVKKGPLYDLATPIGRCPV